MSLRGGGQGQRHTACQPSTMKQPCDRPVSSSVATVAAGQLDRGERFEIKIDNRLQRLGGRCAAQRVGQRFEPGGIGSLQREQHRDGIVPALWPAAAIDRPMRIDRGRRVPLPVMQTIDLMSVFGPGNRVKESKGCPGRAKGAALGASRSVFAAA
jgi:hypothetical protein